MIDVCLKWVTHIDRARSDTDANYDSSDAYCCNEFVAVVNELVIYAALIQKSNVIKDFDYSTVGKICAVVNHKLYQQSVVLASTAALDDVGPAFDSLNLLDGLYHDANLEGQYFSVQYFSVKLNSRKSNSYEKIKSQKGLPGTVQYLLDLNQV